MRIPLIFFVVLVLASGTCRTAHADAASEANLQYELGTELYKQGKYPEAIDRFIASHRLVQNTNVVLNIVRTFEYLKRYDDAYNWYQTYLEALPDGQARKDAEDRRNDLTAKVAVVEVTTNPPGADIYIDRIDLGTVGKSPRRVAVTPGDRVILARLEGYKEGTATATVLKGAIQPAALALAPVLGTLVVQTEPGGALVRLGALGTELGRTPLGANLPVGTARIDLSLPGFVDQTRDVTIMDGQTTTVTLRLDRAQSSVSLLTVTGNVKGAVLLLDGVPLGLAPATVPNLPPGQRRLDVTAPNHDAWSTALMLEPGASTRVDYRLVGPGDRAWPGWRWVGYGTGAGLLIGGGIVAAGAASAKSDFDGAPTSEKKASVESKNLVADVLLGGGCLVVGTTFVWDLVSGPALASSGKVTVGR